MYEKVLKFGGIDEILTELKLKKSVLQMRPYISEIVREF